MVVFHWTNVALTADMDVCLLFVFLLILFLKYLCVVLICWRYTLTSLCLLYLLYQQISLCRCRLSNYIRVIVVTLVECSSWRLSSGWVLCVAEELNVSIRSILKVFGGFQYMRTYFMKAVWELDSLAEARSNISLAVNAKKWRQAESAAVKFTSSLELVVFIVSR